jgi:hypothetical protein
MSNIFKPRILNEILAIIIVFLMSAGAFIGAAENNTMSAPDASNGLVPVNPTAELTGDDFLEVAEDYVGSNNNDNPEPIVPEAEPTETSLVDEPLAGIQPMVDDHGIVSEGIHSDGVISTPGSELDPEVMPGVSENSFNSAMSYITEPSIETDETGNEARGSRASLSIVIGTDNDQNDGQGMGRVYGTATGTTMYSYVYDYWYNYASSTSSYGYKTWAVYDLKDLAQYKDIKITSGTIHYWQYSRYYCTGIDVWSMTSIPYEVTSASTTAKGWYDEIGGTGSVKMATAKYPSGTDTGRYDKWSTLTSGGISELNKRLSSNLFDFSMGAEITSHSSTYGRMYWGDVRLELNFTYTAMPDDGRGEIAVGNDLAGYGSSSTKYDYYNYVYFSSSYRGYAAFDSSMIKSLIPQKGPAGETVTLEGIYLRMNTDYYNYANPSVYHMKNDPRNSKNSWSTIYTDAGDGTKYYTHSGAETVPTEMEWDLGEDALDDFNDTLDGKPNFFALGFTSTGYGRGVSMKLVIKWKIEYPPMKTLVLGGDNPEKAGHSTGYTRVSGTTYYCYGYYYSYLYKSGTVDYHGWSTFDLADVKAWNGVKVKSAKLVIHNQYRYYITGVNFTTIKTTPYHNAPSATAKSVFTESGPSGTQIGSTSFSSSIDTTYNTIEVPLNSAAVTAINTKLGSSSTYYTFGVGMYPTALASGYTYGYLRWTDVRLKLTFEYSEELQPTNGGKGVAYGDNWNGHVYKYTSSSDRPYGYMYYRKSTSYEYRAYTQWDISDIKNTFEKVNVSDVLIKKVSVRFNHNSGTSSSIGVYQMKSNVTKDTPTNVFTDCGDGTKYYSGSISSSTHNEYEWNLGKDAVKDFQKAFNKNDPDFFSLGFTSSSSSSLYDFSPRLVIEWGFPEPKVTAALTTDPVGIEGTLVYFNANSSLNLSFGTGGLRYEWDFNNDNITENITKSPYVQYMWAEDGVYPCKLTVNDTNANKEDILYFNTTILNADPVVDQTNGKISPQPAYEASWVTYSGYRVTDPGIKDTFKYFWDFNGDGIHDVGGNCTGRDGKNIPSESWYYEDDFLGDVSLVVVDDDGGSTNLTTPHKLNAVPQTSATGYVYYYGTKYASSVIYYRWQYTYDYQRGWAKIDLSEIPSDADIQSVIFKGVVSYNYSVNMFGVHLLDSDPVSSTGATVFSEAGLTTNRLFGLTGALGDKEKDLMPYLNESLIDKFLTQGWVGLGFDYESPTTNGYYYGYMQGYSYSMPSLEIKYETSEPGCLIAVNVKNQPPVVNCENMTITPTTLNEGEDISVSGISFCDVGNDSYEAQIIVGGIYESDWYILGDGPIPPGSATDNLALDATASHSGGGSGVWGPDRLNNGDKTGTYNDCWTTGGGWVELDWGKTILVNSMKVYYTRWRVLPATYCLHTCDVQYWDGTSWQTDQKLDDKSYSTNNDHDIKLTKPRKTSKIRLYNMWAGYNVMIQEWEVFGPGSGNWTPGWGAFGAGCFNVNLTVNMTVWDDYPGTGTSFDKVPITVNIRDDDDHKLIPGTGVGPIDGPTTISQQSTTSTGWNGRKIVIDEDYNMYAIFVDTKTYPYKIGLGKSTNGGSSWETSIISPDYLYNYQYYPALDIDSNGYLHAVWQMNPYVVYGMSKDQGKTWAIHNVTTSGYVYTPVLAVDEDDNVHVAWNGYLSSYPYKMYYAIRWANGTWGKVIQLTDLFSYYPDIAVDNNGDVHVAWAGYTSSSSTIYNIRHKMLWTGNNTWSNTYNITEESNYNYYPSMAFDRFNKMHIVWSGQDTVATAPYNIMYTTRTSSGVWGAREYITKITSGYPYQYSPSIAINDAGEMDIIWYGYRSPTWSYPYVLHHAEKSGTSWKVDWNIYTGSSYQYYPRLMYSTYCKAKSGYAFTWLDGGTPFKYWTSGDFEFGDPRFTDGLDFCNNSVTVYNVEPVFDEGTIYTVPNIVKEQEEFILHAEFVDPAAGVETEVLEYNVTWGDGQYTGWEQVEKFKAGKPAGLTKLVLQPDAEDAKDTCVWKQSPYNTYNFATYPYAYVGSVYQVARGLVEFDLRSIPAGYNITNATLEVYFNYRYSYSAEEMRWYPITEGWVEGTENFAPPTGPGVTWDTQPKFNESKPIGSASFSSGAGLMAFPLDLAMVQNWINDPKSNMGMISKFEHEANSTGNYGYFFTSDYTGTQQGPKLTLEFDRPLPALLPRGIIEVTHMYPDDHPTTATPFDQFNITIDLKDDDLGTDYAETDISVHNVPPEITVGIFSPEDLADEGIDEGTVVTLEGFEFDDVAYDEPTENSFEYQVDWGDGSPPTEWMSDFRYPGGAGIGGGSSDIELVCPPDHTDHTSPGSSWNTIPFGPAFNTRRYMNWYDGSQFDDTSYFINKLAFRYNGPSYGTFSITYTNFKVYLSHTSATTLSSTFANNYGRDRTLVMNQASFTWTKTNTLMDWEVIPLDSGFNYDGSSNVVLEVSYTAGSPSTYNYFNADSDTRLGRMWANSATATTGSVGMGYGLVTKFMGGFGGGVVDIDTDCSATRYNNGRKLVMDSNDNFYTIYQDDYKGDSQIFIANSSDLGDTWYTNMVTSDSASASLDQYEPSLVVDSKNVLHAVWRGEVSGVNNIRYANSNNGGVTWGNYKMVTSDSTSGTGHFAPSIAIDSKDTVHITWHGSSSGNSALYNIHYVSRTSTGTWGTIQMVTSDTTDEYNEYASIDVDSSDNVHVTWHGGAPANVLYRKLSSSWGSIEMLTSSTTDDNVNPSIVTDGKGNVHVAWSGAPAPNMIKYIKYDSTTSSWGSVEAITSNSSHANYNPSIGIDHRGYAYVVWYKKDVVSYPVGEYSIMMAVNELPYWTTEMAVTAPPLFNSTTYYPNVMSGTNSMAARGVAFVYTADNGTFCNVYFAASQDFNLTDFGPWKMLPKLRHLYNDDNPSNSEVDVYEFKIRMRDDDLGVSEYIVPVKVRNVWPVIDRTNEVSLVKGPEGKMQTPEIKFEDPGSGPKETWHVWVDTDNTESQTPLDIIGTLGSDIAADLTVINGRTYGTIKPITLPFNDDYQGTVGMYVYDDDSDSKLQYIKIVDPITGDGEVETIESGTLSSSTAMNSGRNLVMDSNGTLYAVYNDYPAPYKIVCSVSDDMGKTWKQYKVSTETIFSSYYQYYPSVAIDSNGVLHAVWRSQASGYSGYQIAYKNSKDGGKTWGNFKMVPGATSGTNYFYSASIAVDSKDTVHIVGYGYSSSTINTPYNIHYINRTSAGTWSSFTMVTSYTSSRYQYYPSIAVDTKDNVHVAWYGYTPWVTYYNIQYRKMDAITGNWGPLVMITNKSSEYHYYPNIVADLQDNVYVAWSGYPTPYKIYCRKFNSTSQAWEATETVFSDGSYNYYPSIGADQRGNMYIAFSGGSPYQIKLTKKTPTGSWETPTLVTDGSEFSYQYYPSVLGHGPNCYPLQGTAIVWSGSVGGYNTMFYASEDFWQGEVFERTDYKTIFDIEVENVPPDIEAPPEIYFMPEESVNLPMILSDQGSDDLYLTINWGDGSANESYIYYNNGLTPEPIFPPTHSALNGTAPFEVEKTYTHSYDEPDRYYINVTLTDDDNATSRITIIVETVSPYELKNRAVQLLEGILPGRLDWIGYETLELRYLGKEKATLLVYNNINRPPFSWETKLLVTFCDLDYNDTVFINGSYLDEGMFGTKLILKLYNKSNCLIAENEIDTVYTCLEPIKIGNKYGDFAVVSFTKHKGTTYHFYSNYACKTEDALDHILRSINRDPRRGYGWWHQDWAWWCGYTYYRTLWLDEKRVDPQLGTIVFCEEQQAVLTLMEVLKNCLDPQGVRDITFTNIGDKKIDVEIYTLGSAVGTGSTLPMILNHVTVS